MSGDFRELVELLERTERSSSNLSERARALRQAPTTENAEALVSELHALQQELKQLEKYFRAGTPDEMQDFLKAISDSIYVNGRGKPWS